MRDSHLSAPYTEHDAISAALRQDWTHAIKINTHLFKQDSANVGILNRLGFAYLKSGETSKAKKLFQKALTLDPYNSIALKNSKLLTSEKNKKTPRNHGPNISPMLFLEEPGKTKIAVCINMAPVRILSDISPGQEVVLKARNHCVEVRNRNLQYLAALPDDLSFKLIKLLKAGNTYQTLVKSVGKNTLSVIIRELSRGKRFAKQPSFYAVSTSYSAINGGSSKSTDKPDVTATGETDEEDTADPPPAE